jgi:sulfur transfer complex TusBCD TusB component (DsrH family)
VSSKIDTLSNKIDSRISTGFESFKKQSQIISFDTSKDTIIKCKEGTVLKIKANSFVRSINKQPVKGIINFEVTEYYKLSDILLANLTTTSKEEQLETGGMLYIEAFQGDELLELKSNSTIDILMPTKKKKELIGYLKMMR